MSSSGSEQADRFNGLDPKTLFTDRAESRVNGFLVAPKSRPANDYFVFRIHVAAYAHLN
jgi:hypothetical protein